MKTLHVNLKDKSKYHWQRDKLDTRDHIYRLVQPPELVSSIDLRSSCSPIENQGQLGSCTANAIAGLIEYLNKRAGKNLDVSRLFIYYQERLLEGTVYYDAGAYIRDGIKAVNKYGVCLESIWPYIENKVYTRPNYAAYTDAIKRKVISYQRILNFAGVKNALAAHNPVVVGFDVYDSFESDSVSRTGIMPYPDVNTEECLGGHAVALVGYNDSTRRFIARNSWGTSWGDRGYFYMPYQVIQDSSMSDDFWVISSIANPK